MVSVPQKCQTLASTPPTNSTYTLLDFPIVHASPTKNLVATTPSITMASSGAAWPTLQRSLQTCLTPSRPISSTLLLPYTQVRHATRATIAKQKAKAEALSRSLDPNVPKTKPQHLHRKRPNRDHNKLRGVSAMRNTGPRELLSVSGQPLPQPVSPEEFPAVPTDPAHGLWAFFHPHRKPLNTPREDIAHGSAWTVEQLRRKGWEDLHALWWVCCLERNRIATGNTERKKGDYGYGAVESREREVQVCLLWLSLPLREGRGAFCSVLNGTLTNCLTLGFFRSAKHRTPSSMP